MEDSPDISWGCNIDSVENATSLQRWLTNSGFPPKKMAVDSVDIREREECAQLTSQCAHLQDRTMALAKELASLNLVSDISLEEVDVLKLAFFENNAKDKRYNRHTRFVSCDIVVSAYIGLWFRPILVCGFLKSLFCSYGLSPCLFRFFGNLRSIVVCVELVFWF
ncbi:hypothetical protein HID58_046242 [Brassica napus]|uniref:Uncharacterized protein n=1 Tax=Brassica napus TaxID=3708 RepID=A0ABQ8AVW8_BRANA|nr:hypothetical protein HID58_046242 [Brassica napus]